MNDLELLTASLKRRTIAGLDVGERADSLTSILAILDSRSTCIDDYTPLLHAAVSRDEFQTLAAVLLDSIEDASLTGKAAYQAEDQIEICRDEVKTILLVKVPEMDIQGGSAMAPGGQKFVLSQLNLLPNDASFVFLGDGVIELRLLQVAPESGGERLEDRGAFSFYSGDVITLRRGHDVFDTISVKGTIWLLQLVINEHSDLVHHYDRESLQRVGVSSADFHATRMEFVMDILRHFPVDSSLEALEGIYESSQFYFVRWKAVQTLLRMDLQRGAGVLMRASSDDHPQVRVAADRTIQNLRQHGHI